jgi:hypothetical protein
MINSFNTTAAPYFSFVQASKTSQVEANKQNITATPFNNPLADTFEKVAPKAEIIATSSVKNRSGESLWGQVLTFSKITGPTKTKIAQALGIKELGAEHALASLELLQQALEDIVSESLSQTLSHHTKALPGFFSEEKALISETLWETKPHATFVLVAGSEGVAPKLQMHLQITPPYTPYPLAELAALQERFERKITKKLALIGLEPLTTGFEQLPSPETRVATTLSFKDYMKTIEEFQAFLSGTKAYPAPPPKPVLAVEEEAATHAPLLISPELVKGYDEKIDPMKTMTDSSALDSIPPSGAWTDYGGYIDRQLTKADAEPSFKSSTKGVLPHEGKQGTVHPSVVDINSYLENKLAGLETQQDKDSQRVTLGDLEELEISSGFLNQLAAIPTDELKNSLFNNN